MNHLMDRLADLGATPVDTPSDDVVAGHLRRAKGALAHRRQRIGTASLAVLAVAGIGIAGTAGAFTSRAIAHVDRVSLRPPREHCDTDPRCRRSPPATHAEGIKLVAYHGQQANGFNVAMVPQGYTITSSTSSKVVLSPTDPSGADPASGEVIITLQGAYGSTSMYDVPGWPESGIGVLIDGHGYPHPWKNTGKQRGYYYTGPVTEQGQPAPTYLTWNTGITEVLVTANTAVFTRAQDVQFCNGITVKGNPGFADSP